MPQSAAEFGRCMRLLDGSQFSNVFKNKRAFHGRFFSVYTLSNGLSHPRIGMAVSKRVSKKAVERNRIKRQARELFRLSQLNLGAIDYVVVAKVGAAQQENSVLTHELTKLWRRVNQKCETRSSES